jgi:hypothetical protein
MWLPAFDAQGSAHEFWASVKFTGPAFVNGSKGPDRLLVDRVFVVKPRGANDIAAKKTVLKKSNAKAPKPIECEGAWRAHCQGVATDGRHIYWSFTVALVKTDMNGRLVAKTEIPNGHMGDLCHKDGKVYIGINNKTRADGTRTGDEVWVYDAATLKREAVHPTPQTIWCNNGIEWCGNSWWIIGNLSQDGIYNYVWEYSSDFRFKCCHPIASGWTNLGVQTICLAGNEMLFGCYGGYNSKGEGVPECIFGVDVKKLTAPYRSSERPPILPISRRDNINAGEGLVVIGGRIWYARGVKRGKTSNGSVLWSAKLLPGRVL